MPSPALKAALDASRSYEERKPFDLIYEELAAIWRGFINQQKTLTKPEVEKFRRILLLGKAFSKECSPLAEKLFNTWLLGPNNSPFSAAGNSENFLAGNSGTGFRFYSNSQKKIIERPWKKIGWSELNSGTINQFKAAALKLAASSIPKGEFEPDTVIRLKELCKGKAAGFKGSFGNIHLLSFNQPEFVLFTPSFAKAKFDISLSTTTYEQLWKERDPNTPFLIGEQNLSSLLVLFLNSELLLTEYTRNKMPDIISALGSFSLYTYAKGSYEIIEGGSPGKKRAIFIFTHIGFRIVDSYDFEGWQALGCWYPERGHDLSSVKFSLDLANELQQEGGAMNSTPAVISSFISCSLFNSDFRNFREKIKEAFNNFSKSYKLLCQEYYVVTPMLINALNPQLIYEFEF